MADLEIKVNVDRLNINTVLARDVTTDSGFILVTKNTMINDKLKNKLIEMEIPSVYIKISDYITNRDSSKPARIERGDYHNILRANFNDFVEMHTEKTEEVRESIIEIGNGRAIEFDKLYKITEDVMDSMDLKSDIMSYLSFMREDDDQTYAHSLNVSLLCNLFGRWIGMPFDDLVRLTIAGLLHDIGKTKIPLEILKKPGRLSGEEYEIAKKHTVLGYEMVDKQITDEDIKNAVLLHHERINGSGYPYGLTDEKIGDFPKIVAICDIYDAMTAARAYRSNICPFSVIQDFEVGRFGELDTYYLLIFLRNIAYAYTSAKVLLSNNQRAEIVFINSRQLSRPIVLADNMFIDLSVEHTLSIVEII